MEEDVIVNICGSDGTRRGIYLRGEPLSRVEVEVKVKNLQIMFYAFWEWCSAK